MTMNKISMKSKIMSLTFFILIMSFSIGAVFIYGFIINDQADKQADRGMLVGRTVSQLQDVKMQLVNLDKEEAALIINEIVEEIRIINRAQYIVVLDMDRTRLSHPIENMIGKKSTSSDIDAAFVDHFYTTIAEGEIGKVARAFVPILDDSGNQLGVVVVGFKLPTILELYNSMQKEILFTLFLSIIFSAWGANTLGKHMKKQMFGLEPHEIAKMYVERTETFNAMHEGIIAIDNDLIITIFNDKACKILGVKEEAETLIGQKIFKVLPDTRLPEILTLDQPIYNKELYVNEHSIMSNRIPIQVNGKTVGAVAMFKDRTDVKMLAEELTGVKAFVQALRVQTHEHKNKLHTIAGLLQLGHSNEALTYITQVKQEQDELTNFLNERFSNQNISGLLLSKVSHGKELGIKVEIDKESKLTNFPNNLDHHDFVLLFGNLIENAFDALSLVERPDKHVSISVDGDNEVLAILVMDNGIGMTEEVKAHIFENGYSTKDKESRGIGLYLIEDIVKKGEGHIEVTSEPNKGTSFLITFYL